MDQLVQGGLKCRLCGSSDLFLVKKSNLGASLDSSKFAITDSNYGETLDLYRCRNCDLLENLKTEGIKDYYIGLEDCGYEASRQERLLQAAKILQNFKKYLPSGKILDVGAGSGILVEEAVKAGYDAIGLEPSSWLQKKAAERGLPVFAGVLPSLEVGGNYDAVALIDVIEHVESPVDLLLEIKKVIKADGLLILTTPDLNSFFANILRWRWWHFRIAHISYFNLKTLKLLFSKTGFEIVAVRRPSWYFSLDYLFERIKKYLPVLLHFKLPKVFKKIIIPLNLFDSYEIICRSNK